MLLTGLLLFGAGCMVTVSAPYYPYGEPRGEGISWTGVIFLALGIGMVMIAAVMKALNIGRSENLPDDRSE